MNKSNQSKHVKDNPDVFNWSMLANAPKNTFQEKAQEAYFIVLEKPILHEQLKSDKINLFQNNVMWLYYSVNILIPWVFKL